MPRFVSIVALLLVAGCSAVPGVAQVEAVTLMGTEKTIGDHLISYTSGKDCSTVRLEKGKTYCKEDAIQPPKVEMHCYRELGGVTCYERPAQHGKYQEIDRNDHNIPR